MSKLRTAPLGQWHPVRVHAVGGYQPPGAPRKKRALPPAILFDPAQRGPHQIVAGREGTDGYYYQGGIWD